MTTAYSVRPYTLWGRGKGIRCPPVGREENDIFSWRGNRARNGVTLCRRVQKLGDRRKNCYDNKQQRIKFFVFANKWKEKEEKGTERELSGEKLAKSNRRSEVSMLHLESCLLTAETDRILCHLIML